MIPAELRTWRAERGYTQAQAAAALGVSLATYGDWERGMSRTTGKAINLPKLLGLACAAVAKGLAQTPIPLKP